MKRKGVPLLLGLLAALWTCSVQAATLIHTNDILGEMEPCGCRSNPQGGIARLSNLISRQTDRSLLFLDAGDLLFNADVIPELLKAQSELQAKMLLDGLEKIGLDARVPGEKDFALGLKLFDQLARKGRSKVLAANLKRGGALAYGDHAVFERKTPEGKKLKIGVFGLVGPELSWPNGLKATPAIAAAKAQVAALRAKKVDLVIALTHQGYDQDVVLTGKVPGIDLVVGAHSQSFLQKPPRLDGSWVLQASFRNQYIGVLPLSPPFQGETLTGYQLIGLDAGYDSPADALTDMDRYLETFKKSIGELNAKRDAELNASVKTTQGKFHTFAKCAECHLKQFEFWRKTQHTLAFTTLYEKQQHMNKDCLRCHTVGLGDSQGFSDVNRLAEVLNADPEVKAEALSHVELNTFLKFMREADSLKSKAKLREKDEEKDSLGRHLNRIRSWTPVQCENCHRFGGDHPFGGTYAKKVETTTCLQCHTQDRAPAWYMASGQPDPKILEAKKALVSCPAGELPDSDE